MCLMKRENSIENINFYEIISGVSLVHIVLKYGGVIMKGLKVISMMILFCQVFSFCRSE